MPQILSMRSTENGFCVDGCVRKVNTGFFTLADPHGETRAELAGRVWVGRAAGEQEKQ